MREMDRMNRGYMKAAPSTLSRIMGVANLHAAHCGVLKGTAPLLPRGLLDVPFHSHLLGETQMVDRHGQVLARRKTEDGPGVICADLDLTPASPTLACPSGFWIPELAWRFRFFWWQQNLCGRSLYRQARAQGWSPDPQEP